MAPEDYGTFRRRAFAAAGPVFLVALGLVLLMVLGVQVLLGVIDRGTALGLGLVGLASLLVGLAWGGIEGRKERRAEGSRLDKTK